MAEQMCSTPAHYKKHPPKHHGDLCPLCSRPQGKFEPADEDLDLPDDAPETSIVERVGQAFDEPPPRQVSLETVAGGPVDRAPIAPQYRVEWETWMEMPSGWAWVRRHSGAVPEDEAMSLYKSLPGSVRNAVIVEVA